MITIYPQSQDPLLAIMTDVIEQLVYESGMPAIEPEEIDRFLAWLKEHYKVDLIWALKYQTFERIEVDDEYYVLLLLRFVK